MVLEHMEDPQGNRMEEVPGGGYRVRIPLPVADAHLGLLAKNL